MENRNSGKKRRKNKLRKKKQAGNQNVFALHSDSCLLTSDSWILNQE
jgi:hypothetical protein